MRTCSLHQYQVASALIKHSSPDEECIPIDDALNLCRVSDVKQVAWELDRAGVRVSARALLAMVLARAVVRQVAEQFACQERLRQEEKAVTRTGDKQHP